MLILTGQKMMDAYAQQELEVGWLSGELLSEPKIRTLTGKKSGKSFTITSLFVKYDGDTNADYTITVECWGAAGRDAQKAHKRDGIICCGLIYSHEYNGKYELRCKIGIDKTMYEPVCIVHRGGIAADPTPKSEEAEQNLFSDVNKDELPF